MTSPGPRSTIIMLNCPGTLGMVKGGFASWKQ